MNKPHIGVNDFQISAINNQRNVSTTGFSEANSNRVYFITAVVGSSVTLKDGDGNTVAVVSNMSFPLASAIRIDGGLQITASGAFTVFFFHYDQV